MIIKSVVILCQQGSHSRLCNSNSIRELGFTVFPCLFFDTIPRLILQTPQVETKMVMSANFKVVSFQNMMKQDSADPDMVMLQTCKGEIYCLL